MSSNECLFVLLFDLWAQASNPVELDWWKQYGPLGVMCFALLVAVYFLFKTNRDDTAKSQDKFLQALRELQASYRSDLTEERKLHREDVTAERELCQKRDAMILEELRAMRMEDARQNALLNDLTRALQSRKLSKIDGSDGP